MFDTAEEIIGLRDRERTDQATFRSMWQETADLVFPRENQITSTSEPGTSRTAEIYDTTARFDSKDMASDMSSAIIAAGREFFGLGVQDQDLMNVETVSHYLSFATEVLHEDMLGSNFMLQFNESLRSLHVFGTCNLFTEWGFVRPKEEERQEGGLNYKDFDIAMYQILENAEGRVDNMILSFILTARQSAQKFGVDNLGDLLRKALEKPETQNEPFEFIHYVGPREDGNPRFADSRNMPFRSVFVDVKDKLIVEEGGFREFPFAVARWSKSSSEKYGRGIGTEILPVVRTIQQVWRDFVECGNRHNNPPREVLDTFEGIVDMTPGATNFVQEMGSIKAVEGGLLGNFPINEKVMEFLQGIIHKAFFRDIFAQLMNLTGDRRTTVEIRERIKEGLRRLASPMARMQAELLDPTITRSLLLEIRNGKLPPPPPELAGQELTIEYKGELALALRDQQAKGFLQFASVLSEVAAFYPGAIDILEFDDGLRDVARSQGVKTRHIATDESVAAKREARQQQMAAQQALELGAAAAQAAGQTSKAPEEGSPAAEVMAALKE